MKNYIFKTILLLAAIIMVTGCEQDLILFDTSMKVVGFSSPSVVIKEDAGTGDVNVYLGAIAGATADVSFTVSTDGLSSPAIEGTHYTIAGSSITATTGLTPIVVTVIDDDVFGGDKQFKITITEGTGFTTTKATTVTVTISDNEHPLKQWIGTYDVAAPSYGSPGAWDEAWTVVTGAVEGDPTKLSMVGIGGGTTAVIADVDLVGMTISIDPGQTCGDPYGYGDSSTTVYYGFEDLTYDDSVLLTGTIEADGTIKIDNWCHLINDDWVWDVFNTTWTKQ